MFHPLFRSLLVVAFTTLGGLFATAQNVPIQPTDLPTPPTPARPVPEIVQKWRDAWNSADGEAMAELFTDDGVYQDYAFQAQSEGKEGVAAWVNLTAQSISDVHVEIVDAFQTGDRVAVKWVFSGTPLRLGPIESNGESFAVPAVSYFELKGEQIARVSDFYNRADLLGQLGLPDQFAKP